MGPPATILLSAVILLSTTTTTTFAFNITRLLDRYPNFSQFNALLTQTRLFQEINTRRTITVLALANDRVGGLAGKPEDVAKRILSSHVVLDYYDLTKLNNLKGDKKTMLTTLYQASGVADGQQGFLHVANTPDGIFFSSAMKGSPIDVKLEGSVAAQPYNISVLSVSGPITVPGIDAGPVSAPPPARNMTPPAESPVNDSPADAPAADADAPTADAPAADADAPAADADAPAADADAPSPTDAPAPSPGSESTPADVETADTAAPSNGAGEKMSSGAFVGLILGLVSLYI